MTDLSSSTSRDEKLISDDDELMSATVPWWMATARPTAMPQNSIGPKVAMFPRLGTPAATGGRVFACLGESGRQVNFKRRKKDHGGDWREGGGGTGLSAGEVKRDLV